MLLLNQKLNAGTAHPGNDGSILHLIFVNIGKLTWLDFGSILYSNVGSQYIHTILEQLNNIKLGHFPFWSNVPPRLRLNSASVGPVIIIYSTGIPI
jgi:hypothetical protein